jgi:hypothetical protein
VKRMDEAIQDANWSRPCAPPLRARLIPPGPWA